MYGIQKKDVSNRGMTHQVTAEALKRGIVFKAPEEAKKENQPKKIEKLRLNENVKLIWNYDNSLYQEEAHFDQQKAPCRNLGSL